MVIEFRNGTDPEFLIRKTSQVYPLGISATSDSRIPPQILREVSNDSKEFVEIGNDEYYNDDACLFDRYINPDGLSEKDLENLYELDQQRDVLDFADRFRSDSQVLGGRQVLLDDEINDLEHVIEAPYELEDIDMQTEKQFHDVENDKMVPNENAPEIQNVSSTVIDKNYPSNTHICTT